MAEIKELKETVIGSFVKSIAESVVDIEERISETNVLIGEMSQVFLNEM